MVKRTATYGGANKKMKLSGPLAAKFSIIEKAFTQVSDLPPSALKMLVDCLPMSLGQPQDARHAFQTEVVNIIGKMFETTAQGLDGEISKIQEQLDGAKGAEEAKEKESEEAQKKLDEKEKSFEQRTYDLAAVAKDFRAAKSAYLEAKSKQVEGDAELEKAAKKVSTMEAAVKDMITPLTAPTGEELDTDKMTSKLISFLSSSGFEESLITALKPALAKAPAERGDFDQMCFKELSEEVSKRIADLQTLLSAGAAGKQERAAAVQAAEETKAAASKKQIAAAAAFTSAESERDAASEAVDAIHKESRELNIQARNLQSGLGRAQKRADAFKNGPLATFKELEEAKEEKVEEIVEDKAEESKADGTDEAMTVDETVAA